MTTSHKVTLWTIQHINFYRKLLKEKMIYASFRPEIESEFIPGYNWLMTQMEIKIGQKPSHTHYPIWAWYQWNGIKQARPDLRYSSHLYKGTHGVRLTIQKDIRDILLSDFELWHSPFYYKDYIASNHLQEELFEQKLKKQNLENIRFEQLPPHLKKEIEESWQLIFDINKSAPNYLNDINTKSIQATFWSLNLDEVMKVEEFIAR